MKVLDGPISIPNSYLISSLPKNLFSKENSHNIALSFRVSIFGGATIIRIDRFRLRMYLPFW